MLVTDVGIDTRVNLLQPRKAICAMLVTDVGISISVTFPLAARSQPALTTGRDVIGKQRTHVRLIGPEHHSKKTNAGGGREEGG